MHEDNYNLPKVVMTREEFAVEYLAHALNTQTLPLTPHINQQEDSSFKLAAITVLRLITGGS